MTVFFCSRFDTQIYDSICSKITHQLKTHWWWSNEWMKKNHWTVLWSDNVYVNPLRPNDTCVGNPTIIGSDNGLKPARYQAIIWTNAGIFVGWTFESTLQWSFDRNSNIFTQESAFEGVVCVMAAILSRPQGINMASALRVRFTDTGATIWLPGGWTVCNYGIRYTCI